MFYLSSRCKPRQIHLNYIFHCSVKTKVSMFFIYNFNIFVTILKLPVIYHASLHCSLFANNTQQAAQLTITFILSAEMNQQYERTRFALNHRLIFRKRTSLMGIGVLQHTPSARSYLKTMLFYSVRGPY